MLRNFMMQHWFIFACFILDMTGIFANWSFSWNENFLSLQMTHFSAVKSLFKDAHGWFVKKFPLTRIPDHLLV